MDTTDSKYECEYCGKEFQRSFNLNRHIETIHNQIPASDESIADSSETNESVESDQSSSSGESEESQDVDEARKAYGTVMDNYITGLHFPGLV